jgi:hypothetical protein
MKHDLPFLELFYSNLVSTSLALKTTENLDWYSASIVVIHEMAAPNTPTSPALTSTEL